MPPIQDFMKFDANFYHIIVPVGTLKSQSDDIMVENNIVSVKKVL